MAVNYNKHLPNSTKQIEKIDYKITSPFYLFSYHAQTAFQIFYGYEISVI